MNPPLFSIIVPAYNAERTIASCLKSILQQSYSDIEVLIMDGVSSDGTLDIARSFRDNRIRICSEKDKGIYDAMNKGIRLAKGEWLMFLGSDDTLYSEDTLSNVVPYLTGYDVVYGNVYSSRFGGLYDGEFSQTKIITRNICHQAIFFKKRIFDIVGTFNLNYIAHADWDHNMRWLFSKKIKHRFINVTIANYADDGFSSRNPDAAFAAIRQWKYNLLRKKHIKFTHKLKIIKSELLHAYYEKEKRKFITIVFQIPYFLL